jgi:hypothetical protein
MSVNITQFNNYVAAGEFSVGVNTNENNNLLETITFVEEEHLTRLLGARLYNALQTDLAINNDGTATAQKWIDFINGVSYVDPSASDYTINYQGVLRMLKGFVFWQYISEHQYKRTSTGVRKLNAENSSMVDTQMTNALIRRKYNKSVDLYLCAQHFIDDFKTYEATATSIVESPSTTYTVTISDTKYLANGDTVTIEGNEYTVANLVNDTSFEFTATTGLTFTDLTVNWQPFKDFKPVKKHYIQFA